MSFESGSIACRICYVGKKLPQDAVEKFARLAAPPLQSMSTESIHGWVGGRHLLDVPITDNNSHFGGYLRLTLMKAERKVPNSLLRAECMLEQVAYMQTEGKSFVDRKTRSEIRKEVMNRLLPQMPPSLQGISFVYDERAGLIYIGATSESQLDAFRVNFLSTVGHDLIPVNAATTAAKRSGMNVTLWGKTSFSPEVPDAEMDDTPGLDFLTWLWFASEARDGIFNSDEHGSIALALEGPLLLTRAGNGAHETVLRQGLPTASAEAKTALLSGKKLARAKLMLAKDDQTWSCAFAAEEFVFRGLKLPEPEGMLDPASRFQDRMLKLGLFADLIFELFDRFLNERGNDAKWSATKKEIHRWSADRSTRR